MSRIPHRRMLTPVIIDGLRRRAAMHPPGPTHDLLIGAADRLELQMRALKHYRNRVSVEEIEIEPAYPTDFQSIGALIAAINAKIRFD